MANTSGLFDSAAHVEASDRMQDAMKELKGNNERQEEARGRHLEQENRQDEQRVRRVNEALAIKSVELKEDRTYVGLLHHETDDLESEDEAMLDEFNEDPELERFVSLQFLHIRVRCCIACCC